MSHAPHADANDPFQKRTAVAIAIFTVILAFANMLTNQARTEAILSSNRATNKWSYYQSKSTKQNLVKLEQSLLPRLGTADVTADVARLTAELARYDSEKETIKAEGEHLAALEHECEHKEHYYDYAATIIELAIILASVALLMNSKKALYASAAVALASVGLLLFTTYVLPPEPVEKPAAGHHEAE